MTITPILRVWNLRLVHVDYGFTGGTGPDGEELHCGSAIKLYRAGRLARCWVLS